MSNALFPDVSKPLEFAGDIVFLLDSSSVVTPASYNQLKNVVKKMAKHLNVAPRQSRAAVVVYGSTAATTVNFDSYIKLSGFQRAVDSSPAAGGTRRIDRALEMANQVLKSARTNLPRVVVLLATGRQSRENGAKSLVDASRKLRNNGVKRFVIMIDNAPNPDTRDFAPMVEHRRDITTAVSFENLEPMIRPIARRIALRPGRSFDMIVRLLTFLHSPKILFLLDS